MGDRWLTACRFTHRRKLFTAALTILVTNFSVGSDQDPPDWRYPVAVTAADDGTIYVADRQLPGIWKIVDGRNSVYFQASGKLRAPLNSVRCLAIDHKGRLLAGDSATRDIYVFDETNDPSSLTNGAIGIPMSIAVAPDDTIYTADLELHRIWKLPPGGTPKPQEFAAINSPRGLDMDAAGNLWVLSSSDSKGQIQMIRPDGMVVPFVSDHPFHLPQNLVRTEDGTIYVTDNYHRCIWRVTSTGDCEEWVNGRPLDRPTGLCRFEKDFLVVDPHIRTMFQISPDGLLAPVLQPARSPGD